jgi:steroid delta-isomerase-like uncharacterized protein
MRTYMQLFRSNLPSLALTTALIFGGIFSPHAAAQTTTQGVSMAATDQASTIHRFYEQCLNQNRPELIPELFSPNVVLHSSTGDATGLLAIRQTVDRVRAMFPDYHFVVEDVITNGDKAAARWSMTATNTAPIAGIPPTGRPITQNAIVFYRFEDGKITEFWLQMDQLGVLRQIGVKIPGVQLPATQPPTHPVQ